MCCSNLFKNDKSVAASKALGDILGPWGSNPLRALGFVCVESWLKTSKWINDDTLIRIWKKFIEIISVQSPKKHFGGPLLVMHEGRVTVLKFEDPILHLSQGVSPVETQSDTGLPKEDCTPLLMFFLVIPLFHPLPLVSVFFYWGVLSGWAWSSTCNLQKFQNLWRSSPSLCSYSGAYHPACCELNRNSSKPGAVALVAAHLVTMFQSPVVFKQLQHTDWGWDVLAVKIAIEAGNFEWRCLQLKHIKTTTAVSFNIQIFWDIWV